MINIITFDKLRKEYMARIPNSITNSSSSFI